jgi:transposase InsO family protein
MTPIINEGVKYRRLTRLNRRVPLALAVYLSTIIDCFDGPVISWPIGTHPDAELVNTMLDAAIDTVAGGAARPIVHSDRGAHYRRPGWLSRIGDAKLVRSMSRKGCSQDNAAGGGFFGRLWWATTIDLEKLGRSLCYCNKFSRRPTLATD